MELSELAQLADRNVAGMSDDDVALQGPHPHRIEVVLGHLVAVDAVMDRCPP